MRQRLFLPSLQQGCVVWVCAGVAGSVCMSDACSSPVYIFAAVPVFCVWLSLCVSYCMLIPAPVWWVFVPVCGRLCWACGPVMCVSYMCLGECVCPPHPPPSAPASSRQTSPCLLK